MRFMTILKLNLFILLSILVFSSHAKDKETPLEMSGTFLRIAAGDYLHLVIQSKGKEESFWCYLPDMECEDLIGKESLYKNKPVIIKYQNKKSYIEEAGKEIFQRQAIEIKFQK